MPTGLEIINDSGSVLIDENYPNICLTGKGSFTFVSGDFNQKFLSIPFFLDGLDNPIVAIRVTGGQAGLRSSRKNNIAGTSQARIVGTTGATVEWWCFDVPPPTPSSFGLQVYNASGVLTFDSGQKYARVVDYWTATSPSAWDGVTKSYASGRSLACAFLTQWYYRNGISSAAGCSGSKLKWDMFYEQQMCEMLSGTNNTKFTRQTWREDGAWGECVANDPRHRNYNANIAMLDVTGY